MTPEQVTLDDGTALRSDLTIWAGGLRVTLPSLTPAPELTRGGRVVIDETLRIPGSDRTYCIGDAAAHADQPLPQLGSVAKQQGIAVAHSIRRHIKVSIRNHSPIGIWAIWPWSATTLQWWRSAPPSGSERQDVLPHVVGAPYLSTSRGPAPADAVRSWVHEQVTGSPSSCGTDATARERTG